MGSGVTLEHIKVVDVGTRMSTAWCSRLLADFGAQVLMVEPDGGHEVRSHPPFDQDGASVAARYVLANKQSAPSSSRADLVSSADVIVTSDLGAQALQQENPNAIVVAITAYGQSGAYSELPGNELTAYARSGWAFVNGLKGRPPLKGSGYQASYQAGALAYGAVVCALIEQLAANGGPGQLAATGGPGQLAATGGPGQLIDISELETLVSTSAPAPLRVQYSGFLWERRTAPVNMAEGPAPVEDGYFALPLSRPVFWKKALDILGLPDLADDPELQQPGLRHKHTERYADAVAEKMLSWQRMDLFHALADQRVIAGPVLRVDEMGSNPQFEARGFFARTGDSATRYPGAFARMSRSRWQLRHEMQEPGAGAASFAPAEPVAVKPVRSGGQGQGPLSGFRGLVLTQAWAGTYATELLALLGAQVVQVEVRNRLDSWRGSYQNPIPKSLQGLKSAKHPWNCSPLYNSVNLNKQCVTLDLSEPDGVEIFKGLLPSFDFVAENFSPRVMGNLGLSYESLCEIKPDIILASLSAYGAVGPWARVPGIGGTIEPSSGMSSLLGYEGEHPQNSGQMYPDPVAGLYGFGAIATALLHRDRTGLGQYIDLSMQEANFTCIGDAWMEYELTGNVRGPMGNRHPLYAPHGMFPAAGDDQWIAISAQTDEQWRTICSVLDIDGAAWPTNAERKANEAQLDELIGAATAAVDKVEVAETLARAGVPAAPLLDSFEIVDDEVLRERGHLVHVDHPETGPMWQSGVPVHLSRTPGAVVSHAPLQSQHSFEVFNGYLGMTEERYAELVERGITGKGEYKP